MSQYSISDLKIVHHYCIARMCREQTRWVNIKSDWVLVQIPVNRIRDLSVIFYLTNKPFVSKGINIVARMIMAVVMKLFSIVSTSDNLSECF